ncbi:Hypothetical protein GLP15_3918 [Giardia lamblia P15]|uniref:Uncharacterized protein n=1 Tax=Giardia intestinalis (strain P15) TaxID=658858 RepID=E1F2E9_GIAIA|nr:Hypothetical protein GLP15_3918 [Giardia lamblia P15]
MLSGAHAAEDLLLLLRHPAERRITALPGYPYVAALGRHGSPEVVFCSEEEGQAIFTPERPAPPFSFLFYKSQDAAPAVFLGCSNRQEQASLLSTILIIFTAVYKQSARFQTQQLYPLYEQFYRLLRLDPLLIQSSTLVDLLEYSSHVDLPTTLDTPLVYRYEAGVRRYFSNVLHLWALETSNLLSFGQGPCVHGGNSTTTKCAYGTPEYNVFVPQIRSFADFMRKRIKITSFPYADCFNLTILEKLAQMPSLFSFILTGSQKHSHLLSIKRHVDQALDNKASVLHKMICILARSNSNTVGEFNRLSYFSQKQAGALKSALQLAIALLPYVLVIHRVSTSYYHIVHSDIHEELSLDLLGDAFFTAVCNRLSESREPAAYDLIAYSLGSDITLAVQHAIGPDHLFATDILLYRRNLNSALRFLDRLERVLPESSKVTTRISQLRLRCQDLLDLSMWQYQYHTALRIISTGIYEFPSSLLTVLEETVKTIQLFIPDSYSTSDTEPTSNFTYALTLLPTEIAFDWLPFLLQGLGSEHVVSAWPKDLINSSTLDKLSASGSYYPICGRYRPTNITEQAPQRTVKAAIQGGRPTPTSRSTAGRKKPILKLTLDVGDLQASDTIGSSVSASSFSRVADTPVKSSMTKRERSIFKYNHPKEKLVIKSLTLATLFKHNFRVMQSIIRKADFNCIHSISVGLQRLVPSLAPALESGPKPRSVTPPILPLHLGRHIIAVRTLLERQAIFAEVSPLLLQFILASTSFLLYIKHNVLKASFNIIRLDQYYSCVLFIEHHYKHCVILAHIVCCFGTVLLKLVVWKVTESPLLSTVTEEFLSRVTNHGLLDVIFYLSSQFLEPLSASLPTHAYSRLGDYPYKHIALLGQKLPCPAFLTFLWLFDQVFTALKAMRDDCYHAWSSVLNQTAEKLQNIMTSVPISIASQTANLVSYSVCNIDPLPSFIRSCHLYQVSVASQVFSSSIEKTSNYPLEVLCDVLNQKYDQRNSFQTALLNLKEDLLNHGSTVKHGAWILPPISPLLSQASLSLFQLCISTSILHKHRRLESLLSEHLSLCTRLHESHLWTLVKEQRMHVDALFKRYLSNPAFIWQASDTIEQFLQDLSASIKLLLSQTNTLSTITTNLRNSLMSYAPALEKRVKLPITQSFAPVSEFLALSRSWSDDQLPDSIVVHIINDILSQESELGDAPKYFIPRFTETIYYHDYLSFGSMVLADACFCNNSTNGDGLSQQVSLFINTCNQIEERIYLFKRSIENQLDSYCQEVELLCASFDLSDELLLGFFDDLSLTLHELAVVWMLYLYLLCSPKTPTLLHVATTLIDDKLYTIPTLGSLSEVPQVISSLLSLLSLYKTTEQQSMTSELWNVYSWAKKLICADPLLLQPPKSMEDRTLAAVLQTVTGRLAIWVVSVLQIPLLIDRVLEKLPELNSLFHNLCTESTRSARFDYEHSVLSQYLPLNLLFSDTSIVHYYKFDGLLFYITRLIFFCHSKGCEQFDDITSTISASHAQLSNLKQSEDIVLMDLNTHQSSSLFLENLLDYLGDILHIQGSIDHIPSTKQFNRFFAEFLRFKTFITEKESHISVITCGLYLLRSTGLSEPLISQASTIVKDLSSPILCNLYSILNLYLDALSRVEKECCTHLKHAMGQLDDSRSLIIEYRYYPIIPSTLEPAALIRTIYLLRSIFKVDALKKLYEQINNRSQVLILYMQKNGIDIEPTFKQSTEKILALQGAINITYEKVKYLVDSTRASLLAYTVSANEALMTSLHDFLSFRALNHRESLSPALQCAIKQRALTGTDIRNLYVHGSQILLFLEDSLVRIRHVYSKLCYHYELCYLQGIYGPTIFAKTAHDMLGFIRRSIEGTEFPNYLRLITSYQTIWGRLCQVADKLLYYEDKSVTLFYTSYAEILTLIKDSYTLRRQITLDNAVFLEFLGWYEDVLHILQEELLSIINLKDFTPEQWQDLIYHIGHVTQSSKCMVLYTLDSKTQLTLGNVLLLKLNTHPDILRGKISMALVSSAISTRVTNAISHWSDINTTDFIALVGELSDMMECTDLKHCFFAQSIAKSRAADVYIDQYFDAHDLLALSIIQRNAEEQIRRMLQSTSLRAPHTALLLEHLDTLRAVADMECSERSFPTLTDCQVYLRTILDVGFVSAAFTSALSRLYNFLIVYSYMGYEECPNPFTAWTLEDEVSECLAVLFRILSIHKYILRLYDNNLQFRRCLLSDFTEDSNKTAEHIEAVLAFLYKQKLFQKKKEHFSLKNFNLFCKRLTSYFAPIKPCAFSVPLYQVEEISEPEDHTAQPFQASPNSRSSTTRLKDVSIYPLIVLLYAALKAVMVTIIDSIRDSLPHLSLEQSLETSHITDHAVAEIRKSLTPYNLFYLFSKGLNVRVTLSITLSFSQIDLLLNGLVSGGLYFSSPNHKVFLQALSEVNGSELTLDEVEADLINCSLFRTVLLSAYCDLFLKRLLAGYQKLITDSEDQNIIIGYMCSFPSESPMIFYRPINLCAVSRWICTSECCNLHPLWFAGISVFHAYEETLRIGSLLALRELRALCSLSLSVDLCTNPSATDEDHARGVYLTYGCYSLDVHQYEFVPFQAMYIGARLFLSTLCLFQYDYTGRATVMSSTSNDFLIHIYALMQKHMSMLTELPLQLLALQEEGSNEIQILSRLIDLPSMQWKSTMLWLLFKDFCEKLKASEATLQALQDRTIGGGKSFLDPDLIAKDLLQRMVNENVLFLQMELSIFPGQAISLLNSLGLSFSSSKAVTRDTMYCVSSSPNGIVVTRSLFAQIASSISSLPMMDLIRVYSPTLSTTRSYLNGLLTAASCQSMLSYGLQLVSLLRSTFQAALFSDDSQVHRKRATQLFTAYQAQQTVMEIASVLCFSNMQSKQLSAPVLSVCGSESVPQMYSLILVPIDSSWETFQQQDLAIWGSNPTFDLNPLLDNSSDQLYIYRACVKIANLIRDSSNGKVTCRNLERALAKFLYHLFAGTNIESAEKLLYLSIDELLQTLAPLSLVRTKRIAEHSTMSVPFDSRVFMMHAQSILQQMVSLDLDERLLQCMDSLLDWLLQLVMRLRYLFIVGRSINVVILCGPVFSYVYILPWIFYRALKSSGFPTCYSSEQSEHLSKETQAGALLSIRSLRLLSDKPIKEVLSLHASEQPCHRTILMLTIESLTDEQRNVCHRYGIPILNTVRPIADANDFKHLELLSLYTNLHAWCYPIYPKINGTWHFTPLQSSLISMRHGTNPILESHAELKHTRQQDPGSIVEPTERLQGMHLSSHHQRKLLSPRIVHSFIELSGVYRDLVEKAVSSTALCSYYRYHAITGALSIVLAILDTLLMDPCIRVNILRLETKYFHAIVVFSCSWAYAALPIRSHRNVDLKPDCASTSTNQAESFLYVDLSIRKRSPLLLRTVPQTLHISQATIDSAQISWPVFLSNALGSLVLTKIGCHASNIYDFVPAIRVESKLITDALVATSLCLEHRPWPELAQTPRALVPQIVVMLCQLYAGERLLSTDTSLSHIEFSTLSAYISHFYSLGVQSLPAQRCLEILNDIFILSDAQPVRRIATQESSSKRRLTPLQVMHYASYPLSQDPTNKSQSATGLTLRSGDPEFCPLVVTAIPIFPTPSSQQHKVHSYAKTPNQILHIFDHYPSEHHIPGLHHPMSMVLLQGTYPSSQQTDSWFTFMTPRINSTVHTLVFQLFQPLASTLPLSCDQDTYIILIQLTLQAIQDYREPAETHHSLNIMLSILAPVQSLLEGFALNEKITRSIYRSLVHEELVSTNSPVLTPSLAIFAWLLSAVDFYTSCFSKSFYDSTERSSFNELKEFCGSLLSLASFKASKVVGADASTFLSSSVKSFDTMELLEFYEAYPLFAISLGHTNLFLPLRLRSISSFPIRAGSNTMNGVLSSFATHAQKLEEMVAHSVPSPDSSMFLRLLSLQKYQQFLLANNTSLPLPCPITKSPEQEESATSTNTGTICTRAIQCINFRILCDLFSNVHKILHSTPLDPMDGSYIYYSHISMPAFRVGVLLRNLSLFPITRAEGISSILVNSHLRTSRFILTEPGHSLRDTLAYACNLRGLIYPLEVVGIQGTEHDILLELAQTLSLGYMLVAWMRKPVCVFISSYTVRNARILTSLISLLCYGYSPEIMNTLTAIEQYTLIRKILGLLYDPSYGPERSNSPILKDFSSIVDGPLERIGTLQISEDCNPSLVKAIRASGLRRFLSLAALAHFSIPPVSSRGRDPTQNYTSQLKLKRTGDPPITVLNTLPELLCSPLDVLSTTSMDVSLSSLLHVYVDVPIYSDIHLLLKMAHYNHIYTSNLVFAVPPAMEFGLVEHTLHRELSLETPVPLQDMLDEQECLKLAKVYTHIITYLSEVVDKRLLFYYTSYSTCVEFGKVLKSLLYHRKHTFTVRQKHYDLALTNLQLVHENSEQALESCRRASAEIQAHSLAFQNTNFELSHLEEEILVVKQRLCVRTNDKRYAEEMLKEASELQNQYKKQIVIFHRQMNRISDYQNSVNPILFSASWQTHKRFQECLSMACLYLAACTSKKVSVFALSVPKKGASKHTLKDTEPSLDTFKRRVSNIDVFIKEMIAPSPEEIVNSPHYQTIKSYLLDAIESISGYRHTSTTYLVPIEQVKVEKGAQSDFAVLPKEISTRLPPFYTKEKARYVPSTMDLLKASVEVRNVHVIADMLFWILLFQMELTTMWINGAKYREVISDQETAISNCTNDIDSLERQLAAFESRLLLGQERKQNLNTELTNLRNKYAESKDMLSTTSSILSSISDLRQAWLGISADLKLKLDNIMGDSIVIATAYTMLLHVSSSVRCRHLASIANLLADIYGYTISPVWTEKGLSDSCITNMTLSSNELMQIQYAALTSHFFAPQAPLYERDLNIILSNTSVEVSGDINVSEDEWLGLINCFGSLTEIEADILRHGSTLIHETFVFYVTALLFGHRNTAILVTDQTKFQGRLLSEIVSKVSIFYASNNGCTRPIFLQTLTDCQRLYSTIQQRIIDSTSTLKNQIHAWEEAIISIAASLHADAITSDNPLETLETSSVVLPVAIDLTSMAQISIQDLLLGAFQVSTDDKGSTYKYAINRQSSSIEALYSKPDTLTVHKPLRLFLTSLHDKQDIVLSIANDQLLSFCSLIDLEPVGYRTPETSESTPAIKVVLQRPVSDFTYLDYTGSLTTVEKPAVSTYRVDSERIYQEVSLCGYVLSTVDETVVDLMCTLQSNADALNTLTNKMLQLVLSPNKVLFLEAIAEVHQQMKIVTAMVIRLKKCLFLKIHMVKR